MSRENLDLDNILPAYSADKFRRIETAATALYGAFRAIDDPTEDLQRRKISAYNDMKRAEERMREGGRQLHEDGYNRAKERQDKLKAEYDRQKATSVETREPWQQAQGLVSGLTEFVKENRKGRIHGGATVLKLHKIKPEVVSDPVAAVDKIRAGYSDLDAEETQIKSAPLPIKELHQRIKAEVDAAAEKGEPTVSVRSREGNLTSLENRLKMHLGPNSSGLLGDAGASFFVWMMKDEIVNKLTAMAGVKDAPGALTDQQQKAALSDLAARRLKAARQEEALILGAEAKGIKIPRRRDADPRAVLEIE